MMNKLLIFMLTILLVGATAFSAFAQEQENDVSDGRVGDPDYYLTEDMSIWDRLQLFFSKSGGELTVIGGATCSAYPDESYEQLNWPYDRMCRWNDNHIGEAFQVFYVKPDGSGWDFLGEAQIQQGDRGCIDTPYYQGTYHWDVYYCDDTVERTCSETDGGRDYDDYGQTTVCLGDDCSTYYDECDSTTHVRERYCDPDDSLASTSYRCDDYCDSGACVTEEEEPEEPEPEEEPSVWFQDLWINGLQQEITVVQGEEYEIKGIIYVTGNCEGCVIETGGDFYGEQYSVVSSSTGACGDDQTLGVKFDAEDEAVTFFLYDKVTREPGRYRVPIFVFDHCYEPGNPTTRLEQAHFFLNVEPEFDPDEALTDCYKCDGANLEHREFVGDCPADYYPNELTCEVDNTVVCYHCNGENLVQEEHEGNCPQGTTETVPECGTENLLKCYYCDSNDELKMEEHSECPQGTTENKPFCSNQELTCYYCQGQQMKTQVVQDDICPQGMSENQPTCDSNEMTCFWCYQNELSSGFYEDECPRGTDDEPLDCTPSNPVTCYWCNEENKIESGIYANFCPLGKSLETPSCGEEIDCYWCEENQVQVQSYASCPTGTLDYEPSCKEPSVSYCQNRLDDPTCTPVLCRDDKTRDICKTVCCEVDDGYDWRFDGQCGIVANSDNCLKEPEVGIGVVITIVVLAILLFVGIFYISQRRRK